jgi:hypothetical protein
MKYHVGQTVYCIGTKWTWLKDGVNTFGRRVRRVGIIKQKFRAIDNLYIIAEDCGIRYHPDNVFLTEKDAEVELAARKLKENIL